MQFVDLNAQHDSLEPDLSAAIARVIRDSAFIRSSDVDEFERRFSALHGASYCVSCANGTDAIYIALRALNVGPGDEVITTAHSWIATSETITQTGARVVFADTEDDYFTIDPADVQRKITSRTKGVIPVHLYGQPANMPEIMKIARQNNLWVIEDSAQAHLARQNDVMVGHFGDIATFSFYPGKNLGAMGDAGAIITERADVARFAALFARHGGKNDHEIEGICSRMDGLQAAILNVKMTALGGWNKRRQQIAARYDRLLSGVEGVITPARRPGCDHVYHLYVIRHPKRDQLRAFLEKHEIPTGIHYPKPLPFYRAYSYLNHHVSDFPVAIRHSREIVSLPMHPFLTEAEQDEVVAMIAAFRAD
jgi:dTDP-4-amino-4,6-dideoxygalactose transaminase